MAVTPQLLVSRIIGNLGTGSYLSGLRVNQDLEIEIVAMRPEAICCLGQADFGDRCHFGITFLFQNFHQNFLTSRTLLRLENI
jgi:hypothetical protein